MSSEVGLGDGLLVCTVLLLLWPKLELVMSMRRVFTSPKIPHQHKHKHRHRNQQDHPISKRSRARFPPGPLVLLCLLAVGCGLLAVGLLLLVALVAAVAVVALVSAVAVVAVVALVAVVAAVGCCCSCCCCAAFGASGEFLLVALGL